MFMRNEQAIVLPLLGRELVDFAQVYGFSVDECAHSLEYLQTELNIEFESRTIAGEDALPLFRKYGVKFIQSKMDEDKYFDDILETEVTLLDDQSGVYNEQDEIIRYRYKAIYTEYPEEGVVPLGEPLGEN